MKLGAAIAVALVAATAAGAAYKPSPLLPLDGAYRMTDGRVVSLAVTDRRRAALHRHAHGRPAPAPAGRARAVHASAPPTSSSGRCAGRSPSAAQTLTTHDRRRERARGLAVPCAHARRLPGRRRPHRRQGDEPCDARPPPGARDRPRLRGRRPRRLRPARQLLLSLGYVVLSYDKRGVGDSTGFYAERPTPANIDNLAGDAVAALRVLAARRTSTRRGSASPAAARPAGSFRAPRRSHRSSTSR